MASFSFGAGNARKIAAIPLYTAGRIGTALIPRTRDEWVFGCAVGVADGALALWREAESHGVRAVWLAADDREQADAAAHGIPSVRRSSLRGWWRTARAAVVVVTHGFGDANRYAVSGAFVVQLWHGIPLKRIGLDSPATVRLPSRLRTLLGGGIADRLMATLYRGATRRIGLIPAASHLVRGRLESAFGLADSQVPVTGEPRVDVLSAGRPDQRRRAARRLLQAAVGEIGEGTQLVLYAPTWRDGEPDPAVPTAAQWQRLRGVLEQADAVLLIRSHPLGAGEYREPEPTGRVRHLGSDVVRDVTPLLPGLDALVTDYSSLVFDSALVPLPVVFLAPDVTDYALRRGFYGRYSDIAPDAAASWDGAAGQLERLLADPAERETRLRRAADLSARVHAYRDGGNAARVYRAIRARLERRDPRRGASRGDT
ncbi:CDP-glycerol glycerophosphotransferase family protein [Microbacterium aureliae]